MKLLRTFAQRKVYVFNVVVVVVLVDGVFDLGIPLGNMEQIVFLALGFFVGNGMEHIGTGLAKRAGTSQ